MHIITLTSDYGTKDFFISAIKGTLLSLEKNVNIIDISHEITPFHIPECAYIVKNAYKFFPKNSIHIIAIDTGKNKNTKHIVSYIDGHYFITSDSGVLSLIFPKNKPEKIIEITISEKNLLFPAQDIFTRVACHIINGGTLIEIGKIIDSYKTFQNALPTEINNGNSLVGEVIYIDRFGNLITNIEHNIFHAIKNNRDFTIQLPRGKKVQNIHKTYNDVKESEIVALFNSSQLLEIAINRADKNAKSGASTLLGIKEGDQIIINF